MTAEDLYRDEPGPFQQGDFLVAPFIRAADPSDPKPADDPFGTGAEVPLRLDHYGAGEGSAAALVELRGCVVVSHDCHLDKQFNQRIGELRDEGATKADALQQAEDDRRLDRWVVVSPIFDIHALRADSATIRRNAVVGLFPVPPNEAANISEGAVDVSLKCTVDRLLVKRVAGMTEEAVDLLRMALMRADLARKSGCADLEDAVGAKIKDVIVDEETPIRARMILSNGEELEVVRTPEGGGTAGPSRTERSAPG